MNVRTHLVAMPWADPRLPSIQIGCLKAYLDKNIEASDCHTYSAFAGMLPSKRGLDFADFHARYAGFNEYAYMCLYLRRFGSVEEKRPTALARLLAVLNAKVPAENKLTTLVLDRLERATRDYIDKKIIPALRSPGINLVGFTLNYEQVYASIYAVAYLRQRCPNHSLIFAYGGYSAALPYVYELLGKLNLPGVVVIGEGERKIAAIVTHLMSVETFAEASQYDALAACDPGILKIGTEVNLRERNPRFFATQFAGMNELPIPDYGEYFSALQDACLSEEQFRAYRAVTPLLVEGSRGCFAKCDFCGLNASWQGFRKRPAAKITADTIALTSRYKTSHINFVDNVCDTWAESYAESLSQHSVRQVAFMELRAHHPEEFWTQLALSGVAQIQIGIEAISTPLLNAIGKGTKVVQNIAAQKSLIELGIRSNSNLILQHPMSTLADITESKRVLEQIPHLGRLTLVNFSLVVGSPIYEKLTPSQRQNLVLCQTFDLPKAAQPYAIEFGYNLPKELSLAPELARKWRAFETWYAARIEAQQANERRPKMTVNWLTADTLRIIDERTERLSIHELGGEVARVYDACHRGLKLAGVVRATGLQAETIAAVLQQLVAQQLVLQIDDYYLSLATRSKDELVRRYFHRRNERLLNETARPVPGAEVLGSS